MTKADISYKLKKSSYLFIRLSSLGDVILSTVILNSSRFTDSQVDWVVSAEFAPLLINHPRIRKVYAFDRKLGLKGWIQLWKEILTHSHYDHVFDLHRNLRSILAHGFCFCFNLINGRAFATRWSVISKERYKVFGKILFKDFWPKSFNPQTWVNRYMTFVGASDGVRTNLSHLLEIKDGPFEDFLGRLENESFYCVMPGAKWAGKRWSAMQFADLVGRLSGVPIICGSSDDQESYEVCRLLEAKKIRHISGVGRWNLVQMAKVLARARFFIGNDTGLAHLAESMGTPAFVIFGPTSSDLGFAPWRKESLSIERHLWCRPCGKYGNRCYRPKKKYFCLTDLKPAAVAQQINSHILKNQSSI